MSLSTRPLSLTTIPSVPVTALAEIAAGLARVERQVPLDPATTGPRSMRLIATPGYDVWLITWPPGTGMAEHDHGRATGVLRVVSGAITEAADGETRTVRPGRNVFTEPHGVHRLWNEGTAEATTLHVYSPPLEEVTYHPGVDRTGASLHPAGRRPVLVAARPAEATSTRPAHRSRPA